MATDGATVERLQVFLRDLSAEARGLLIAELERGVLRGDETPGYDVVLEQLRSVLRAGDKTSPRIAEGTRLFYKPLEPFLVDDVPEHQHPGRISRATLDPMWNWIRRDLLPDEADKFNEGVKQALAAKDTAKAEALTRAFQDRFAAKAVDAFNLAQRDERMRRRLFAQIGTPRATDDAGGLMRVLQARNTFAMMASKLPGYIDNLAGPKLDQAKALVDEVNASDRKLFMYALLFVMSRLAAPWQLIRLPIKAAGSDKAARVAETQYEVAVAIVLAEMERMIGELRADLKAKKLVAVIALLKFIHDAARGLRTELDLSVDSAWGRELAALRAQISDLLKTEIEVAPARARKLLRQRTANDIRPDSELDAVEVAETEALIEFVVACRHFGSELAISEVTQRTFSDLQQYLDSGMRPLIDALRNAGDADRKFRQSQVNASIRFCVKIFGPEYAAALDKAATVASRERHLATA